MIFHILYYTARLEKVCIPYNWVKTRATKPAKDRKANA